MQIHLCMTLPKVDKKESLVLWIGSSIHNASVMPMWRCFWIRNIVIQNCEHGRWEFGGEGGEPGGCTRDVHLYNLQRMAWWWHSSIGGTFFPSFENQKFT
jgi:hypothetical protein